MYNRERLVLDDSMSFLLHDLLMSKATTSGVNFERAARHSMLAYSNAANQPQQP